MYLEQAIRGFSSYVLAERGLSPQTEYAYRHDLRRCNEQASTGRSSSGQSHPTWFCPGPATAAVDSVPSKT